MITRNQERVTRSVEEFIEERCRAGIAVPESARLKDANLASAGVVRHRIAELATGAVVGGLLGLLVWYLTSEAFWLWASPVIAAPFFKFPDLFPVTRTARNSVLCPEVVVALIRVAALVMEAGRANVAPEDVLLYLVGLPMLGRYFEEEGIEVAALRTELETAVSRLPLTDAVSKGSSLAFSVELQVIVRKAVIQAWDERRRVMIADFLRLLLEAKRRHSRPRT
jgi:hypothetical protein